jgi:hypothetical protein
VAEYMLELFTPPSKAGELPATALRLDAAAKRVSGNDALVEYVRAIYVPEDETCFYIFDASSAEVVAKASEIAGLSDGRIVAALDARAPGPPPDETPPEGLRHRGSRR